MSYGLPKSVEISGQSFAVRYDFRVILTIFEVLDDEELSDEERAYTALRLFFVDFDSIPDYDEAIKQLFWFINGGQYPDDKKKEPEIIDWAKDFQFIVSPVNRVLGKEIRESDTLRKLWEKYSREYEYAKDISFDDTCNTIQTIMDAIMV